MSVVANIASRERQLVSVVSPNDAYEASNLKWSYTWKLIPVDYTHLLARTVDVAAEVEEQLARSVACAPL